MRFTYTDGVVPKVEPVCSTDKARPDVIHTPHLNAELAELQATNTYIAVRIPVELDKGEATGPVDKSLLAAGRKAKPAAVKVPKRPKPKKGEQLFPEATLLEVWPSAEDLEAASFRLGVNAAWLKKLADSLGKDEVELIFPKGGPNPLKPIVVRTVDDVAEDKLRKGKGVSRPEGLLMPIRLRGEQPTPKTGSKSTSRKSSGSTSSGSTDRSAAARKAVETRRKNAEAKAGGKTNGNGNGSGSGRKPANGQAKGSVAAAMKGVGKAKKSRASVPAKSAKRNGATADRGKGSDARRAAALKAAETRRQKLAAKK